MKIVNSRNYLFDDNIIISNSPCKPLIVRLSDALNLPGINIINLRFLNII